jgi:hypothetical protein
MLDEHTARIRVLNDRLRQGLIGGRIHITPGVAALGADAAAEAWRAVTNFTDFSPSNDPYGEHDFGAFQLGDSQLFWKIDYFDSSLGGGAQDPADETTCVRVLTIMLAEEY